MLMQNVRHTGLATNTSISTANVGQLGLKYMANTGNWVYSSPVVATVPALGKQLVFVGGKAKFIFAFDTANGDLVWRANVQNNSSSTGAYYNGVLYIGSSDYNMYAFNAATGQQICKLNTGGVVQSSPTVVNPDGSGLRVYFGDAGLGGAPDGGHIWSMHGVDPNDAFADCSVDWSYDHFGDPPDSHGEAGSWSDASFGQLTDGTKVIVIGASSTDNAAYAFNALTGARIWRFPTPAPYPDADVGAGTTLSPPGALFPDGAAYIAGKNHHVYGINLRTGAQLWDFNMEATRLRVPTRAAAPRRPSWTTPSTSDGAGASSASTRRPAPCSGATTAPTTSMWSPHPRSAARPAAASCSRPTWPDGCSRSTPRTAPSSGTTRPVA